MAFTSIDTKNNDNHWKAQGFLNIYLPTKEGKRRKLGMIPLKDTKPNEASLRAWLEEDPSRVAILLAKLEMEYQSAEQSEGAEFDLNDDSVNKEIAKLSKKASAKKAA